MKFELFVIYDRLSGIYGSPECQVNKDCAKRWFAQVLSKSPSCDDLDLYYVGTFDSSSCKLFGEKPVFVASLASLRAEVDQK